MSLLRAPSEELDSGHHYHELRVIRGFVVFARNGNPEALDKYRFFRSSGMQQALDTYQPELVVKHVAEDLELATEPSRLAEVDSLLARSMALIEPAKKIKSRFDPEGEMLEDLVEELGEEDGLELYRYRRGEKVDSFAARRSTDEGKLEIYQAATIAWDLDRVLEETGHGRTDLILALGMSYEQADNMYADTLSEALLLAKISTALEQDLL